MRSLILAIAGIGMIAANGQTEAKTTVSGNISNLRSDTIFIRTVSFDKNDAKIDTLVSDGGKFNIVLDNPALQTIWIAGKPVRKDDEKAVDVRSLSFLLFPESKVDVTGTLTDYKLDGNSFYGEVATVRAMTTPYQNKIDSLRNECLKMKKNGVSDEEVNAAFAPASEWAREITDIKKKYIERNPESNVAVYLLGQLPMNDFENAMSQVSESAKTGVMAPYYNRLYKSYEKEVARKKAAEAVQPGNPAPNFTLKDINGNDFSLSSLKGKYVVLDFWGSWCGWCIKGIPEMKKTYEKYKGKIEFVGIDNGDTEEAWKEAVKEHGLPWVNVINSTDPDVVALYGVRGFPTKFVIDPEGKVAKQVVGEDPEFYKYIDSLMEKVK